MRCRIRPFAQNQRGDAITGRHRLSPTSSILSSMLNTPFHFNPDRRYRRVSEHSLLMDTHTLLASLEKWFTEFHAFGLILNNNARRSLSEEQATLLDQFIQTSQRLPKQVFAVRLKLSHAEYARRLVADLILDPLSSGPSNQADSDAVHLTTRRFSP